MGGWSVTVFGVLGPKDSAGGMVGEEAFEARAPSPTGSSSANSAKSRIALMFHGVGDVPSGIPAAERPYWISKSFFREIVDLVRSREFEHEVVLTFDDGNSTDLFAASELVQAGLKGHFFVLAGRMGTPGYLDSVSAREIVQAGMEVGLHGHSHVNWRANHSSDWKREIGEARSELEDAIDATITSVAIPFGYYDRKVLRFLMRSGFDRIYTSDPGPTPPGVRIIRRSPVMRHSTIEDVIEKIEDKCSLYGRVRRTVVPFIKRWR